MYCQCSIGDNIFVICPLMTTVLSFNRNTSNHPLGNNKALWAMTECPRKKINFNLRQHTFNLSFESFSYGDLLWMWMFTEKKNIDSFKDVFKKVRWIKNFAFHINCWFVGRIVTCFNRLYLVATFKSVKDSLQIQNNHLIEENHIVQPHTLTPIVCIYTCIYSLQHTSILSSIWRPKKNN